MRLPFRSSWAGRLKHAFRGGALRRNRAALAGGMTSVPPTEAARWEEAFVRVESYLRAYRLESRIQLGRLTEEIITAARALAAEQPTEDPITLAIHVAQARVGEWTVRALGQGDWTDPRFRARGRLALLMAEVPKQHPQCFLGSEALPPETRERLAAADLQPGPDLRLAGMPSAPLEFATRGEVVETWTTFSRKSFVRAAASWIAIAGLAELTWLITHR